MIKRLASGIFIAVLAFSLMGCGSAGTQTSAAPRAESKQVSVGFTGAADDGNTASDERGDSAVQVTSAHINREEGAGVSTAADQSAEQQNTVQNSSVVNIAQKIIFTGRMDFQTLEFDKTRNELCDYMTSIGAYQQSTSVNGGGIGFQGMRSAVYVFRVPKAKYGQAFIDLREFGTVVFEQSNGEDVTDRYFDTEARLKSLEIQRERLLELLKKAAKMEDILKIEKELQTTNYEIENLTGTLKKWDSLVEYSTFTVNINEVVQIKPVQPKENDGFFHRISAGFKNSVTGLWKFTQDMIVALAAALPVLIPLGIIGFAAYRLIRRKYRKSKAGSDKSDIRGNSAEATDSKTSDDNSEK
ncbi:DUF4349 domain-containing protein [Ruminiclostridium cellobioparum]|uniref:DUF4349 domain-containing protein n=1 Tax=Ruminiclostridium cellobioparum TaxID=29355 RepID=UPI0028AB0AFA|nr:DUF4349 domain-containing protein [Ruminiclostridium cellobioparum]